MLDLIAQFPWQHFSLFHAHLQSLCTFFQSALLRFSPLPIVIIYVWFLSLLKGATCQISSHDFCLLFVLFLGAKWCTGLEGQARGHGRSYAAKT